MIERCVLARPKLKVDFCRRRLEISPEMEVYKTKAEKVDVVANFLMNGPPCGWLFLVGMNFGGEGKSMATNEGIMRWRNS